MRPAMLLVCGKYVGSELTDYLAFLIRRYSIPYLAVSNGPN